MTPLSNVRTITVPQACIDVVHAHLRRAGQEGYEGMGLWLGTQQGDRFVVTHGFVPTQKHIKTADGVCVVVGSDELHRINVGLYRQKLMMVAQIHSHPGRAYHSSTDDEFAVATAVGCLSLVIPNFAREPFSLLRAAIYRLDSTGRWRALSPSDVAQLIRIED